MQSKKKHKRPAKLRVNAADFAGQYAANVGSYDKAINNAELMEKASRANASREDIGSEEAREAVRTANFWLNVVGILRKHQLKMTGGSKIRV